MNGFQNILDRARDLDAAAGSPVLLIQKLADADGRAVTLRYSEVVDLEVLLDGLVSALAECRDRATR